MRRVLFIANHLPPVSWGGGSTRSATFAKYLPEYGWQPVVVTEPGGAVASGQTTFELHSALPFEWPYNVRPYGWLIALLASGRIRRALGDCDLIYVSCPPFPVAVGALALARGRAVPTVLDFRDAWSLDPYVHGSRLKKLVHKHLFPGIESRVLARATRLITNTPSMQRAYRKRYPNLGDRCVLIPNGFDDADFGEPAHKADPARFRLTYCGRLGHGGRSPRALLQALAVLADEGVDIDLRVVGTDGGCMEALQERLGRRLPIDVVGAVTHARATAEMLAADALLLYQERTHALVTPVAGKTYEYLFSGRAILGIAPEGDNLELIRRYARRCETVSSFSPDEIVGALRRLHADWRAGRLGPEPPDREYLARYHRKSQAKDLAAVFDEAAGQRS